MTVEDIQDYVRLLPAVDRAPYHAIRLTYDVETDTFSVSFKKPGHATDSEITQDDVIVRYEGDTVIGFTILHASRRTPLMSNVEDRA